MNRDMNQNNAPDATGQPRASLLSAAPRFQKSLGRSQSPFVPLRSIIPNAIIPNASVRVASPHGMPNSPPKSVSAFPATSQPPMFASNRISRSPVMATPPTMLRTPSLQRQPTPDGLLTREPNTTGSAVSETATEARKSEPASEVPVEAPKNQTVGEAATESQKSASASEVPAEAQKSPERGDEPSSSLDKPAETQAPKLPVKKNVSSLLAQFQKSEPPASQSVGRLPGRVASMGGVRAKFEQNIQKPTTAPTSRPTVNTFWLRSRFSMFEKKKEEPTAPQTSEE
eukprot:GEMP01042444.1.p1 GENE.GEMP01042444.1~~GEMP01042444.1.p1  ORF type:complete len:285 (+),score=63.73 GEMP01042444.1:153-1007(+)